MEFKQWFCGMFKGHTYSINDYICEKCGAELDQDANEVKPDGK